MRKFLMVFGLLGLCAALVMPANATRTERIATIVNDDIITFSDINNRMQMIISSSRLSDTQDVRTKLMPQVLAALIDEQIRLQEANRLEITVSSEEIDQAFMQIAAQNNMSKEQFSDMLRQGRINIGSMERQIESQIAWQKVVQKQLHRKVQISDVDIDDVLERLANSKGKTEYLLAEIFLPVDELAQEKDVKNLANKFVRQIKKKEVSFVRIAQQFSKAAGSSQGGDIGWIREGYLPEELDEAVAGLGMNEISAAVRSLSGYHIFFLRDKRIMTQENIPTRDQISQNLGLERLDRLQRRHFLDLKAAAFIEKRV